MNGLGGFRAQGMDGRKTSSGMLARLVNCLDRYTGSGTVVSPAYETICEIFTWGAGGGDDSSAVGGGGGGASYKRVLLGASQLLTYAVGAAGTPGVAGGDTVVTGPGGLAVTAKGGGAAAVGIGVGGSASGGDINRRGGNGANGAGGAGEFGGPGGPNDGFGGPGGGAGFSDIGDLSGGAGGGSGLPISPGGGGRVAGPRTAGTGRVLILFTKVDAQ